MLMKVSARETLWISMEGGLRVGMWRGGLGECCGSLTKAMPHPVRSQSGYTN